MRKTTLIVLFLLTSHAAIQAQPQQTSEAKPAPDSLINVLKSAATDSQKIDVLLKLSRKFAYNDFERALDFAQQAKEIAEKNGDTMLRILACNNLSRTHGIQGSFDKALAAAHSSLDLCETIGYKRGMVGPLFSIMNIYFYNEQDSLALDWAFQCLKIVRELNDEVGVAQTLNNIAAIYEAEEDYDNAKKFALQALEIKQRIGDEHNIAFTLGVLGKAYRKLGENEKALDFLLQTKEKLIAAKNDLELCNTLAEIAAIYVAQGDDAAALPQLTQGLEIAERLNSLYQLRDFNQQLALIFERKGDVSLAYDHLSKSAMLADSIHRKERDEEFADLQAQYETRQKQKALEQEAKLNNALFFTLALALVIVGLLYVSTRLKRKTVLAEQSKNHALSALNTKLEAEVADRKNAENALQKRQKHMQSLLRVSEKLELAQNEDDIFQSVFSELREQLPFENYAFFLLNPESEKAEIVCSSNSGNASPERFPIRKKSCSALEAFAKKDKVVCYSGSRFPVDFPQEIVDKLGNHTLWFVPIRHGDAIHGTLGMGAFSSKVSSAPSSLRADYLNGLADHLSAAFERINAISAQRKAQKQIDRQRAFLRQVLDIQPNYIFATNQRGEFTLVNKATAEEYGQTVEEMLGQNVSSTIFSAISRFDGSADDLEIMAAGEEKLISETPFVNAAGEQRWLHVVKRPIVNDDGEATQALCIAIDISKRKEAEDALLEEKERLSVTLSSIADGVIATDLYGKITLMNRNAEVITGVSEEDAFARTLDEVFISEKGKNENDFGGLVKTVLESGELLESAQSRSFVDLNGASKRMAFSIAPIRDVKGKIVGTVAVLRDTTELEKMAQEALKLQKLESLGLLAGGIAHDFNNILTGVLANISITKMHEDFRGESSAFLDEAEKACYRARGLTNQLLTFSRGGAPVKRIVSLRKLLKNATKFSLRGSNVDSQFSLPNDLWCAEVDEGQLNQAINNIVLNSKQAMENGGVVRVEARNVSAIDEKKTPLKQGKYIEISIRDSGRGISARNLRKIFDPYFTTKEKGSGLGLATAHSIIQKHGGCIFAESEPGKWTEMHIFLPATQKRRLETPRRVREIIKGKAHVLYMDDDPMIRSVVETMLSDVGYTVHTTKDGHETLRSFKEKMNTENAFDIVVLDLTIPGGMGGAQTIEKLRRIDPAVKAIVASGYSDDEILARYGDFGFAAYISKPFNIEELGGVIHDVLNDVATENARA